jgi:hypothetical protein
VLSFTPLQLYLRGKRLRYTLNRSRVGPRASLDDMEKRKFLPLPALEHRPLGRPARSYRYTDCIIPAPKNISSSVIFSIQSQNSVSYGLEFLDLKFVCIAQGISTIEILVCYCVFQFNFFTEPFRTPTILLNPK